MRFAGNPTNRGRYNFSPSISYPTVSGTSAASQSAGGIVPALYNQNAQTGWQPGKSLETSIGLRALEKSTAINADAKVRMSEIMADATVEGAKAQADAYRSAASQRSGSALASSAFGAIAKIGVGLLSDEKTKNTIEPLENALSILHELKPVTFYYNKEYSSYPERLHYGFIAQDYKQVMPDATYYDESLEKLCIDTNELISLLVRAVQQLSSKVTRMEAELVLKKV